MSHINCNTTYIVKINEEDELTIKPILAPKSFNEDSWETIIANVRKGNIDVYKSNLENDENNTKEITLTSDDTNISGTYTVRIANTSTPDECITDGFSQTACGFVIEFADIITTHNMNSAGEYKGIQYDYGWNVGGYPGSSMYKYIKNDIFNLLPKELKEVIVNTKVVSSHGLADTTNFETTDKLYLLSTKEVYGSNPAGYETSTEQTRQLDYYKNKEVTSEIYSDTKKKHNENVTSWWLRSATNTSSNSDFYFVNRIGAWSYYYAYTNYGISPAFRIG